MITTDTGNKFLVIDDEFGPDDEEDTLIHLGVPKELGLFAKSYDEAVTILKNKPEIKICFVDFNIPQNNQQPKVDYEKKEKWLGELLIPEIRKLNSNTSIVVYSAYADQAYLQNFSEQYKDTVTAFFEKPYGLDLRKQLYLDSINNPLTSSFNYNNFDKEIKATLLDRAKKLKALLQETKDTAIEIQTLLKRTSVNMITVGKYLNEVRQIIPHGHYELWVREELKMEPASTFRMMRAATRLESFDMELIENIPSTALYHLTEKIIPQEDLKVIIESSRSQPISIKQAEVIKKGYKDKQKKETEIKLLNTASTELINNTQPTKPLDNSSVQQNIIQVIPRQRIWHLGANQQHKVIAAEPNSPNFLHELPPIISLCLAFPPEKNWQFVFENRDTTNVFDSKFQDLDDFLLLEIVVRLIEISTDGSQNIAVCYIPNSKILSVIHELSCNASIADPDYQKCLDLVESFNLKHNSR